MAKPERSATGFRSRLFIRIIGIVAVVTVLGALLSHRHLSRLSSEKFLRSIEQQVSTAQHIRLARQNVLSEICLDLSRKARIHAALEDDALDLLYPSAANELRQIARERPADDTATGDVSMRAQFYRFLDARGKVIPPGNPSQHGLIPEAWERRIELEGVPMSQQIGYLHGEGMDSASLVSEVFTVPIISNETYLPIAALVVGFPFDILKDLPTDQGLLAGMLVDKELIAPALSPGDRESLRGVLETNSMRESSPGSFTTVRMGGIRHRLVLHELNKDSRYPLALGFYLSSLVPLRKEQTRLLMRLFTIAGVLMLLGLAGASITARRLARPVEALAVVSEEEHRKRIDAEVALDSTSRELERAARFSADASHQLKTPVAVVRAGLEELLVDGRLPASLHADVKALIGQTGRLTLVIEDLLLLSRLDAGRLDFPLAAENLRLIIEGLVDDLSILPKAEQCAIEMDLDDPLWIKGNSTFTSLILQSLLENSRKYNRPGGRIRIKAHARGDEVVCRIGNTGQGIHPDIQPRIFERFNRGMSGENVPGYGLGLNLAMELTRLHDGKLELLQSGNDWTEFALTLHSAPPPEDNNGTNT